jgi:hypothetical protein
MPWTCNDIIGVAAGFGMFSVFGSVTLFFVRRSQEFSNRKCSMSIIAILILLPILINEAVKAVLAGDRVGGAPALAEHSIRSIIGWAHADGPPRPVTAEGL